MKTYLDYKDIELIENNTSCLRDRLFIRLLFHPGFRVSEALALKIGDVDFEGPMVTILHLKTRIKFLARSARQDLRRDINFVLPVVGLSISLLNVSKNSDVSEHYPLMTAPC